MDAEETSLRRLDRNAEQLAFEGPRGSRLSGCNTLSTKVSAVLANTEARMRPTHSYSGHHFVQRVARRREAQSVSDADHVDGISEPACRS